MNLAVFSDVPFKDEEAFQSWLNIHNISHAGLTQASEDAGFELETFPIADFDEQSGWMQRHALMHRELAEVWGIEPPPDLEDWDLSIEEDFYDWMLTHSQEHTRISLTVGIE